MSVYACMGSNRPVVIYQRRPPLVNFLPFFSLLYLFFFFYFYSSKFIYSLLLFLTQSLCRIGKISGSKISISCVYHRTCHIADAEFQNFFHFISLDFDVYIGIVVNVKRNQLESTKNVRFIYIFSPFFDDEYYLQFFFAVSVFFFYIFICFFYSFFNVEIITCIVCRQIYKMIRDGIIIIPVREYFHFAHVTIFLLLFS